MSTKYKILFAWDVQHDYYAGLKCTDFDTVPSPATASLMKQHQLLLRAVGNKWIVLTKVNANNQPQSPLRPEQKLVFYQRLGKPLFMEVTNLNRALLASQRFYFTNLHQNKRDNALYLTSAIPVYTDAAAYETGQFVANGSGTVFEALRAKAAGHTHATTDTDFWVSKGDFQYVESSDMIAPVAMVANYNVPAATQFDVRIYTLDTVQNTYTKLAKSYHEKRNEAVGRLQIDLRGMEPGRYRIEINGTAFEVYADNDCTMGNCFGIVEIFNHLPGSSDFALLDTHGRVKDTKVGDKPVWLNFLIRYANRRTFWKYITRAAKPPGTPLINSIKRMGAPGTDPPAFDAFSSDPVGAPTRKDYFVSKTLLALTEATDHNNFEITFTDVTYGAVAAPKPNLALSGSITRPPTESNFYCNIYLNY